MKKINSYRLSLILLLTVVWVGNHVYAQVPIPAPPQQGPIMLVGGTAHLGNGSVVNNAIIAFDNGKLTIVSGTDNSDRSGYKVIDVSGKHVYPGFILANSQVGLVEVSSIRAMSDNSERGSINPNVRSIIAYNTDSEFPATFRFNGILLAETTPTGGVISGTSSVVEMDGWNYEDAAHTMDMAMHMNWPSRINRRFDFETFTMKTEPNKNYDKTVGDITKHFKDAVSYGKLAKKPVNLKMEAMQGLFAGDIVLMIHTNRPKEIVESVKFAKAHGVQNITVITNDAAWLVRDFLKENKIPVILPPTHNRPPRVDSDYDFAFKLPALLTNAGITVSLSHSGMLSLARNLPFFAGTAAAYGVDKEEALKMITSNPASALGVSDRVGTLEVGKDATLFVSDGDALDIRTNKILYAFISGKEIVLDSKQQELFRRYSDKYGHTNTK